MFYHFSQNNSGGEYLNVFGEHHHVVVQAESAEQANEIFESLGEDFYFDGVEKEMDCECCGDRWYRVEDCDGKDSVCDGYCLAN